MQQVVGRLVPPLDQAVVSRAHSAFKQGAVVDSERSVDASATQVKMWRRVILRVNIDAQSVDPSHKLSNEVQLAAGKYAIATTQHMLEHPQRVFHAGGICNFFA